MADQFSRNDEEQLSQLFQLYRNACPQPEPGANFMPTVWARIEARHSFSFAFGRLGRTFAKASAAVCLLLAVLNLVSGPQLPASYPDALLSDTAEQTYYTEAVHSAPAVDDSALR